MSIRYLLFGCLFFGNIQVNAQSLPITIDSHFDDWTSEALQHEDPTGDGSTVDLRRFAVANDEQFLFLRFETQEEIHLTDDNAISIFLDTDNNLNTGKQFNGLGAELEILVGWLTADFFTGSTWKSVSLNDLHFRSQPTVSGNLFEIAIGRNALPDGLNLLFSGNAIKIAFKDRSSGGDWMPNAGTVFPFVFDNSPTPSLDLTDLKKDEPELLRLMTYNVLQDGFLEFERRDHFKRIVAAIQPDIVTFNECWSTNTGQAATFMNEAVPLGNFQSWNAVKLDAGNITLSKFPILESWEVYPNHRLTVSLIDLPNDAYSTDLLLVNAHLKCCGDGNYTRQLEADAFVKFMLDAKTTGGVIDLPEGTPFVLSGDLNLVGDRQQLTTLLTGNIVNTGIFGAGGALDWDGSELLDIVARQTDQRMAYTWEDSSSEFPPSRLDYHICSASVMQVEKAFTLNTAVMSPERLDSLGLQANDSQAASDHFPRVTDFRLGSATAAGEVFPGFEVQVSPNPAAERVTVQLKNSNGKAVHFYLFGQNGKLVRSWEQSFPAGEGKLEIELAGLTAGVYYLEVESEGGRTKTRFVKLK